MSTKWDGQARQWWSMLSPEERIDVCENIFFPAQEGELFRLLLKAHLAWHFFTVLDWHSWELLCNSFRVSPYTALSKLAVFIDKTEVVTNGSEIPEGS